MNREEHDAKELVAFINQLADAGKKQWGELSEEEKGMVEEIRDILKTAEKVLQDASLMILTSTALFDFAKSIGKVEQAKAFVSKRVKELATEAKK